MRLKERLGPPLPHERYAPSRNLSFDSPVQTEPGFLNSQESDENPYEEVKEFPRRHVFESPPAPKPKRRELSSKRLSRELMPWKPEQPRRSEL